MSYTLEKKVFTGHGAKMAELYQHNENKNLLFRQYFETHNFSPLIFENAIDSINFLKNHFKSDNTKEYFIFEDSICYKFNNEPILYYFCDIKENQPLGNIYDLE